MRSITLRSLALAALALAPAVVSAQSRSRAAAARRAGTPEPKAAVATVASLNDAIVFDLFLNYELTEKNGNSSTLIDYVPRAATSPLKRVEMTSNYGGEDEHTVFTYGERGRLARVDYRRGDRQYVYEVAYDGDRPSGMSVAGMPRIRFGYRNDTLVTITRERSGGTLEYTVRYTPAERRADLALVVAANGKRMPSPSRYWLTWDDRARLTAFELDVYSGRDITHTDAGDVATFTYVANDEKRTAAWEYVVDAKSSWTERRFAKLLAKRTIEYAAR